MLLTDVHVTAHAIGVYAVPGHRVIEGIQISEACVHSFMLVGLTPSG